MTTKLTPHPLAPIIHAWADGVQIQRMADGEWFDVPKPQDNFNSSVPDFASLVRWRIKPETVRYRLYLRLTESGAKMSCTTDEKYGVQDLDNFIKWMGDWVEKEI